MPAIGLYAARKNCPAKSQQVGPPISSNFSISSGYASSLVTVHFPH